MVENPNPLWSLIIYGPVGSNGFIRSRVTRIRLLKSRAILLRSNDVLGHVVCLAPKGDTSCANLMTWGAHPNPLDFKLRIHLMLCVLGRDYALGLGFRCKYYTYYLFHESLLWNNIKILFIVLYVQPLRSQAFVPWIRCFLLQFTLLFCCLFVFIGAFD